jgi:hypothetical protein
MGRRCVARHGALFSWLDWREHSHSTKADDQASQRHQYKATASNMPRRPRNAGADVVRDHGAQANDQSNQGRGLKETNHAGGVNCRSDRPLTANTAMSPIAPVPAMTIT